MIFPTQVIKKNINPSRIYDLIKNHHQIAIFSHINADGDALGAQLSLFYILRNMNKEVLMYNNSNISQDFSFLDDIEKIKVFDSSVDKLPQLIICVDCANFERLGLSVESQLLFNASTVLCIDHHVSNEIYADYYYVDSNSPATCEILAFFAKKLKIKLSKKTATALFLGISTDTGSFLYESVTPRSLEIASWLLANGANHNIIRSKIYENISKDKIKILCYAYDHIEYFYNDKIAVLSLSFDIINKLNISNESIDGLVGSIKNIENVEVSILLKEISDNKVKISLRSKSYVDVNKIAQKFGGGGHIRAAGITLQGEIHDYINILIEEIVSACKELRM